MYRQFGVFSVTFSQNYRPIPIFSMSNPVSSLKFHPFRHFRGLRLQLPNRPRLPSKELRNVV